MGGGGHHCDQLFRARNKDGLQRVTARLNELLKPYVYIILKFLQDKAKALTMHRRNQSRVKVVIDGGSNDKHLHFNTWDVRYRKMTLMWTKKKA